MDMAVTVLPQPDSPTRPRVSPACKVEAHPGHGPDVAPGGGEVDGQVPHLQERGGVR